MTKKSAVCTAARSRERSHDSETAASYGFRVSPAGELNDRDPAIGRAVARAKSGDTDAISFLYLRYKDNVYGYVLSIVRDAHEAEDVTQTVFMKLISVIHKYARRQAPFTAWILKVARNVALDSLRQRRPVRCEEVIESSRPADDLSHDRRWGLEHALATLTEDQRDVVVLRHLVGLSPGEIADRMGRTESSIHGLHHRARLALRRELIRGSSPRPPAQPTAAAAWRPTEERSRRWPAPPFEGGEQQAPAMDELPVPAVAGAVLNSPLSARRRRRANASLAGARTPGRCGRRVRPCCSRSGHRCARLGAVGHDRPFDLRPSLRNRAPLAYPTNLVLANTGLLDRAAAGPASCFCRHLPPTAFAWLPMSREQQPGGLCVHLGSAHSSPSRGCATRQAATGPIP